MKTKVLAIIALLTLLFAPFAHAGVPVPVPVPVPEKIIASDTVVPERFYRHNENYKQEFTIPEFNKKYCLLNPKRFKKCSDYEFRHQKKGMVYYPALPEPKEGTTIKQTYKENEVYRILFPKFEKFQNEICKNNPELTEKGNKCAVKNIKTTINLKITDRPKTYLIPGEKYDPIVVIDRNTYVKAEKGEYYRLTQTAPLKTTETKTTTELITNTSTISTVTKDPIQENFEQVEQRVYFEKTLDTKPPEVNTDPQHRRHKE